MYNPQARSHMADYVADMLTGRQAIPEIRSTNPSIREYADYPRELHHDPPGPSRYPTTMSLGPSPPNSRSRFPPSGGAPSNHRLTNGHRQEYYDRSGTQPEMQLPMHSGPPSRNGGSPACSNYSESGHMNSSNGIPRVPTPDSGPTPNSESPERGCLPPIYTLTQTTARNIPSQLPPINPSGRSPLRNPYSQPLPPQPPHADPRYAYDSYTPHPHDPSGQMGRPVEFQNVDVGGEKSNKKRRGNLPKQTTDILRQWLHEHLDHAYPNEDQKAMLIRETGLTDKQVSNWFINARRRNVPRLLTQAEQEQEFKASRASSSGSPPEDRSGGKK
ncbi:MAG: hypothetical protein LQ348_004581 [Seirophora lacunosa]|nr:MAG: hypothetical protein LQ348_004581 [Seirophora lacunosa]